jgi:hypothetical protein
MAETLLSPGVLTRENDLSLITQQPLEAGAAIIGPTAKGPVEKPKVVTSYSEYKTLFGTTIESGSNEYTYLTSISAFNYFQQGGTSLLVTRVTTGSFTPATSTQVSASISTASSVFVLETLSEGISENSNSTLTVNHSLPSGTADNLRWEIVSPNTASGTFTLLVRRGDDNKNDKVILETFTDVNLDPFSNDFITKRIGDLTETLNTSEAQFFLQQSGTEPNKSRYVRVKEVNTLTPNYFDNDGNGRVGLYSASIPHAQSGSFSGATGTNIPASGAQSPANFYTDINGDNAQGLLGTDYDKAINLLNNKDEYRFNLITVPGLTLQDNTSQLTTLANNAKSRGDFFLIADPVRYNSTILGALAQSTVLNNSYAAVYWPWVQIIDPDRGSTVFTPASTMLPGVFAFNDAVSEPWFAPAGINRGTLGNVLRAERRLTQANRDQLYDGNINPIATFPNAGVVVFGQKTTQTKASALDRVNVRRLLIALKSFIGQVADNLVFEQNTIATRNNFLSQVNPYLASVQERQGLFAFKVVMDESNNTADVIDRNQLVGQIFLQPTRTAEFIILDFNVLPTGAEFPE